jgi:plastocyanin
MKTRLGIHGPAGAAGLAVLLLIAVVGCGTRQAEKAATGPQSKAETSAKSEVASTTPDPAPPSAQPAPGGSVHRITLTDRGCVRFEPQWTNVQVGQSVSWRSELKSPLTIHVTHGAFDKESFVVRPGATVSTGPARGAGTFSFWTEPAACREAPRGALMAGPGVQVQERS